MFGRHFRIEPNSYEDATITTGTAGVNRCDLICITYGKNETDGTEQTYLEVIKGTEAAGTPAVPAYTTGNILEGATKNQMPLYKVNIAGVVLSSIEPMFTTIPTYKSLAEKYAQQFEEVIADKVNNLAAQEDVAAVQGAAETAQSTANTAKNNAATAQKTAESAQATANSAKTTAEAAVSQQTASQTAVLQY